ncbi:MAG: YbjN domain-containing protein [Pseudomonadota bacterium]|nr:YbjN domain-containing protein [Pseudomonadota bacterium]
MKVMSILAGGALLLALTVAAQAQPLLAGADSDAVLASAKGYGEATLAAQPNGDPLINGTMDGIRYQIYFRNCTAGADCEDINLYAGFSSQPSLETINNWNRDKRFSRAYLDETGDAVIEMDLDMVAGVTPEYLDSQMKLWPQIIGQFATHIGYE